MKIFISQSGDLSRKIADIFGAWIKSYFKNANIFISNSAVNGIGSGKAWFQNITENLRTSDFAISIITNENHSKPWINYEYGVLTEVLANNGGLNVIPLLFGIGPEVLSGEPIQQYQCIKLEEKSKIKKMFSDMSKLNKGENFSDSLFEADYKKNKRIINVLIAPFRAMMPEKNEKETENQILDEREEKIKKIVEDLDLTEMAILRRFFDEKKNTLVINYNPSISGLLYKSILEKLPNPFGENGKIFYQINPNYKSFVESRIKAEPKKELGTGNFFK